MPVAKNQTIVTPLRTIPCPDCTGQLMLKTSDLGLFYGCEHFPQCKAWHKAFKTGDPVGVPANQTTRKWRAKAHKVFDKLFNGKRAVMTKSEAYCYIQELMNLPEHQAHIGRFSKQQCKELISLLAA